MIRESNFIDNTNDNPEHILLGNSNIRERNFNRQF